ncbi:MAG: sigma-70 family RNA polymerase sigma factor [Bacillota bacterium]|nr:sigma-70 family RNA polymerase sigma factor [Bacillota bacterium]
MIDLYAPDVYKLVNRILGDLGGPADVEECCSDVFVAAWEKKRQFNPVRAGLRTWVLILARYKALDYRRKLARYGETVPFQDTASPGTPEDSLLAREERAAIMQALSTLPQAEREILYRRYYLEESVESIAAGLGISRGAVDSRLWRARSALKKALQQNTDGKVVLIHG